MSLTEAKLLFQKTTVVFLTVTGFILLYQSSMIFLSALIGVGIATVFGPAVRYLEEKVSISRFFATLLIMLGLFILFSVVFVLMGSILFEQYQSLQNTLPSTISTWEAKWVGFVENYPQITKGIQSSQTSGIAKKILPFFGNVFKAITALLTGLTLAIVIALFTSTNSKKYLEGLLNFVPEKDRKTWKENLHMTGEVINKWFYAQLIDMAAVAVLTSLGLWIVGVNYWIIYGLLAGLFSIVPYAGILVVLVFSGAVVLVEQPDRFVWLLLVFFVSQQLEGNFILPKVMKDNVQIPAAPLIFLMILTGTWLGPLGVFVTPPLMAIGVCFYNKYVAT